MTDVTGYNSAGLFRVYISSVYQVCVACRAGSREDACTAADKWLRKHHPNWLAGNPNPHYRVTKATSVHDSPFILATYGDG